jgi:hypothetical protein
MGSLNQVHRRLTMLQNRCIASPRRTCPIPPQYPSLAARRYTGHMDKQLAFIHTEQAFYCVPD